MAAAGPVMEKVIEENLDNNFLEHGKKAAGRRNAVEPQPSLKFPNELLYLFSENDR